VAVLLKPQTVAHEGAHQILSNIGVQPHPATGRSGWSKDWPSTVPPRANTKKGIAWGGLGTINALHMATIRELTTRCRSRSTPQHPTQPGRQSATYDTSRVLDARDHLTPTDYAQAWAMTHYLAFRRRDDFVKYLKAMGQIPPLQPRTPEEHLAEFRKFFVEDLSKLRQEVDEYIRKLPARNDIPSSLLCRDVRVDPAQRNA